MNGQVECKQGDDQVYKKWGNGKLCDLGHPGGGRRVQYGVPTNTKSLLAVYGTRL